MKKLNLDICKKIAQNLGGLCLSNEYVNSKTSMKWQCEIGHSWETTFSHIKNGTWCPFCSGRRNNSIEECQKIAEKNGGKCLSEEYINVKTEMIWQCKNGHIWKTAFQNIKIKHHWCYICYDSLKRSNPKNKLNLKVCQSFAENKNGKCLSKEYLNSKTMMMWQCGEGHIWNAPFYRIKSLGHWCPACVNIISKPQIEIYNLLTNYYHNLNIILNDTQTIKPKHLDIYIPELKLAIEYDGEYWHYSDWAIENGALKKLENKNKKCIENNIKLIRIRENAWRSNKELILNELFSEIDSLLI